MAKIVFMGTPEFAIPTLKALIAHHDVLGVVTQPDRPAGRSGEIRQPPVKKLALVDAIPVLQPAKIRKPEAIEELKRWRPDVYIVAAFGQILPQEVLDIPSHGSINVHASLLPRWRGAAPIHAAIRAGDDKAGVTIMKMDAGLDTGPMLSSGSLKILSDDTAQSLHDKLAQLGADLIINTLPGYLSGSIEPQPQPEEGITYAPQIKKDEGEIDWTQSAVSIERLVVGVEEDLRRGRRRGRWCRQAHQGRGPGHPTARRSRLRDPALHRRAAHLTLPRTDELAT
jgi:methionyl-tRNA formyltransferase